MTAKKISKKILASKSGKSRKSAASNKNVAIKSTSATKKAASGKAVARKQRSSGKASPGGIARIRHYDFVGNAPFQLKAKRVQPEVFKRLKTAPSDIDLTLEPKEGDALVYHPTPGFTAIDSPLAQFSVRAVVSNSGTKTVDLDKVIIAYKKGNQTIQKEVFLPSDALIIEPGQGLVWQNSRPYHENGDVVFLTTPLPNKVKLSFYFKGYSGPVAVTKNIIPYPQALSFPFDQKDFGTDEYVTGYSMHGGGDQVFAYDLGV